MNAVRCCQRDGQAGGRHAQQHGQPAHQEDTVKRQVQRDGSVQFKVELTQTDVLSGGQPT